MKVLVVGTTGPVGLGRAVCQLLAQQQHQVYPMVRTQTLADPERQEIIQELTNLAVALPQADLKDPISLARACEGMDVVISTATTTSVTQTGDSIHSVDFTGQLNLLAAAKAAGVKQFIYTSYSKNTQRFGPCPLTDAKLAVEQAVQNSGLIYTILRPSFFTECWLSPRFGFDITQRHATLYGNGKAPISWIATIDVAKFAVAALTNHHAHHRILELGGEETLAPLDLVALCEEQGLTPFHTEFITEAELQQKLDTTQNNPLTYSLTALALALARGDMIPMAELLRDFPEIKLLSTTEYLCQLITASLEQK